MINFPSQSLMLKKVSHAVVSPPLAAPLGISPHDMEPEWGSVETIIYETMQNDMEAELEFWKKSGGHARQAREK